MKQKQKKSLIDMAIQFVKLQLAGNILFWGTYIGFFLFESVFHWPQLLALATASVIAHILFFVADKQWVFADKTGKRKTDTEIIRFTIFMGINFFINLAIIEGLSRYADISPYYGQFISALFFVVWNFVGLRYWVFRGPQSPTTNGQNKKGASRAKSRR